MCTVFFYLISVSTSCTGPPRGRGSRGKCPGARPLHVLLDDCQRDYSPDLCWISTTVGYSQPASSVVLGDFPHSQHRPSVIHIGLQLPIIRGVKRRRWNFRKADWASYTLATERSIPLIPVNNISVEESYQRFCGAMKAARHSIPRSFRPSTCVVARHGRPPPTSCVVYRRGRCWGRSCSSCTLLTSSR